MKERENFSTPKGGPGKRKDDIDTYTPIESNKYHHFKASRGPKGEKNCLVDGVLSQ